MSVMICAKCGGILKCKRNGVTVRYGYYAGYFRGDLYCCQNCGYEVITGLSNEIYEPNYEVDYDFSER